MSLHPPFRLTVRPSAPMVALAALWFLTGNALPVSIEHGTVYANATVNSTADLSLSWHASDTVTLEPGSNHGDYYIGVDPPGANNDGVILASVAENGRDGVRYPTVSPWFSGVVSLPRLHYLSLHEPATAATIEDDANVAFGFFNFSDFPCGFADNGGVNNGPITTLSASPGLSLGVQFVDNGNGTFTLDLTNSYNEDYTSDNGILLVGGAKNENNFALSRANADGTFTIFNHDNGTNGAVYERDPVSFVYIPLDHTSNQIVAMGRILGDGSAEVSRGDFTVTKTGTTGIWHLAIDGHSENTGTLIISPEGGESSNVDNIWSYEWDPGLQVWVIASRDIGPSPPTTAPQNLGAGEGAFSFVFVQPEPEVLRVDANAPAGGDGTSWGNAFDTVQDAIAAAGPSTDIWVAEGTYTPGTARSDTFTLRDGVEIYGGFPTGGGDGTFGARNPNPFTNGTALSGDGLGDDVITTLYHISLYNNATHVVTIGDGGVGTVVDGLTITRGAGGGTGGGMYVGATSPTLRNVRFFENFAEDYAGAMDINGGSPTLIDVAFLGNHSAFDGGAVYISSGASPTFTNALFMGNRTEGSGGAVLSFMAAPTFINCTFAANRAQVAGGALRIREGTAFLYNCVVHGNSAPTDPQITGSIDAASDRNLVEGSHPAGTDTIDADPRFLAIPNAGDGDWRTWDDNNYGDLRTAVLSHAVDQGDSGALPAGITTDAAGNPRVLGAEVDLGAYEAASTATEHVVYVDGGATGLNNGTTWYDAFTDLQDGIAAAATGSGIWVAEGSYTPGTARTDSFVIRAGQELYGGFPAGGGDGTFAARNPAPFHNGTVLSGDGLGDDVITTLYHISLYNNATHVVTIGGDGAGTLMDGFTMTRGAGGGTGGGMYCGAASPTLRNLLFFENFAEDYAGAMDINGGSPSLINVAFLGNHAAFDGGAVYISGGASPTFTNALFVGNRTEGRGGAVLCLMAAPTFINSTFTHNQAAVSGGALRLVNSTAQLYNCILHGNSAPVDSQIEGVLGAPSDRNLIEGGHPAGTNILDADPLFAVAPANGDGDWRTWDDNDYGNLRLMTGSPAVNFGSNGVNPESTDIVGAARVSDTTIDLGPFEGAYVTFAALYGGLDPAADSNGNGTDNFGDYAAGNDPTAPDTRPAARLVEGPGGGLFLVHDRRAFALDVETTYEGSDDLAGWYLLVEGTDYEKEVVSPLNGTSDEVQIQLVPDAFAGPRFFWRRVFSQVAP